MRRLLLAVVLVLAACSSEDGESGAEVTTTTRRPTTSTAPVEAEPAPEPALASDEPCTRSTDGLPAKVPITLDALERMVLTREEVGGLVGWESDIGRHGYWGNGELQSMEVNPPSTCEDLERFGRIVGFADAWTRFGQTGRQVTVSVHAFWDAAGARGWVDSFTEAMATRSNPLPGLGEGAVEVEHEGPDGERRWVMFTRGPLVGWVTTLNHDLDIVVLGQRLSERMADPGPVGAPIDAAGLASAPLPLERYGERGEGLRWDPFFGGCADTAERASVVGEEDAERAAGFGRVTGCTAMYAPPEGVDTSVVRVFSAVEVFRDDGGAGEALRDAVSRFERRGGERFDPGPPGEDAYGVVVPPSDDAAFTQTRIAFRIGRLTATVVVQDEDDADATADVRSLAAELAERIEQLLDR